MWQNLLRDSSFFVALLSFDRDLASQARSGGCRQCGARLDASRYPRKPRGGPPGLPADYHVRDSFCCGREGCRKRLTPPSLRFFSRRVYLGPVFVLASALLHGITPERAAKLHEAVGASLRTLERWRLWWIETFPQLPFWRASRGRFSPPVEEARLPASLRDRFTRQAESQRVRRLLEFLSPLTAGTNWPMGF